MYPKYLKLIYSYSILFFTVFSFFVSHEIKAQTDNSQENDSTDVIEEVIRINDIPQETERLSQRINKLKEVLKPSVDISKIDSLLTILNIDVKNKRDSLFIELEGITRRNLKLRKVEWLNYRTRLKNHQDVLKSRTENITDINEELVSEIEKWENTKQKLANVGDSNNMYVGLDEVIYTLNDVIETVHVRLDSVFIVQKGVTELVLIVDETLSEIDVVELQIQKDYFVFDSNPIWKRKKTDSTASESMAVNSISSISHIKEGLKNNKKQIAAFIGLNIKTFIFQIAFIFFLLILMIKVNKKWKEKIVDIANPIEKQTKIVLSHPISSSIVSGILISSFFYEAFIPAFAELSIILVFMGMIFLLPKLTNKHFSTFLLLLFLAYIINTMLAYIAPKVDLVRGLIILEAFILIVALVFAKRIILQSPENFKPINRIFKIIFPVFVLILSLSILTNIIGMVSFSTLLTSGVVFSIALGLIVYLTVMITVSLVVLLFKLKRTSSIQPLTTIITATNKRIQPILIWIAFIIWVMFTLKGFDLYQLIISWINDLMLLEWNIGEMTISVGGILAFISIFIITLIIAKIISSIFSDDWMFKMLPRGAAPAISLTLRIIIVACGFYIALSAAGLDLSKLGFIIGALGVGIGFGLQNIVLNFISGLILAFERPINIGDTIQVDQEFGVVTNIGVRSSNIKSYSGYESIIPNGDLISKKVNNYTLTDRDRRSKILMKTAASADPERVIELFNSVASNHPDIFKDPAPKTYFYGYDPDGSLSFALLYWSTFSETLKIDSAIALEIFSKLKEAGIQAPVPVRRILDDHKK